MTDIWQEVDALLEEHREKYNLSFALEYSSIIDWHADFTPRRNHPQAREYPLWSAQSANRDEAIRLAIQRTREGITSYESASL